MMLRYSRAAFAASPRICLAGIAGFSALAGGLATPNTARATVVSFSASGSGSDGPLAADAQFTTGAGFIDITLTNDLAANVIRSAGQALSDISFTLSNAPGTLGAATATGQQGNVSGTGLVTYTTGSPVRFLGMGPPPPGGQGTFSITGDTILMEAIGGGKPSEMIAPAIANGGTYTNVNNGFQQFDPYTIGPAMFVLGLSGVTASTTVTAATFSFGTGPDTFLPGTPGTPVPETSTWGMMLLGFAGLGYAAWRGGRKGSVSIIEA